jgi:CIC family chloride channel protein
MKRLYDLKLKIIGKLLENETSEERTYFALTLLTGIIAALIAVSLHHTVAYIQEFFQTNTTFTPRAFVLGGITVLIAGWFTTRKFPSTAGSGIPGVRIALAVYHGRIPLINTVMKFILTVLTLGSGVSLGREGPTVAIASGIGSSIGSFMAMSKKRIKALVAVGAAGGIAAAFNTPISAVVFTLEEVVGDLNAKVLGSIVISSVVASITAQILTGNQALFSQMYYKLNNPKELVFYLIIGLVAAFMGPLWMNTVLKMRKFNRTVMRNHRLTFIMIAFISVGLLSWVHPGVIGSGEGTLENTMLSLILDPKVLFTLFAIKFFSTSLCYSTGMSGGLFMPTLLMGATLGSLVGAIASQFFPDITSNTGAYALVGMGAFFVTVIRAPFTSIIMIFELTRDYNIILPLMIANVVAYNISSRYGKESIYERISDQDGIHLPTREDNEVLETLTVEEAMVKDIVTFNANISIGEAYESVKREIISGYPVLRNGRLIGMVSKSNLKAQVAKKNELQHVEFICEKKVIKIYPDQSLLVAFHRLKRFQVSRLPVVSRLDDKKIIGIITAQDIVKNFGYQIREIEDEILPPTPDTPLDTSK